MTIGERVRVVRKELKMNQTEFAERLNLSTATVSLIEKNNIQLTERNLRDICRVYSVSREWLVDGIGDMHEKAESINDLALSFTELLSDYPGILEMAKLASKHMNLDDWKRINEIFTKVVGE